MILLLVMTDGRRDCIERTLASFDDKVTGPITRRIINDDSGDLDYRRWLAQTYPDFGIIGGPFRSGFGVAIATAWSLVENCPEQYVFHLEDDFTFNRPVDLAELAEVLDDQPDLVQLALRRQPWNPEERAAGGIVEQHPGDYKEWSWTRPATSRELKWLEHRRSFTTNPSLYRRSLCGLGWPRVERSEGHFTHELLADPDLRFGFWGARASGEWVTHIGDDRVGVGY